MVSAFGRQLCEPLSYGLNINKGTHTKLQGFRELIEGFMTDQADKSAYEIGTDIIRQSGIINDVCQDTSPENLSRKENIEELVNGMNDFLRVAAGGRQPECFSDRFPFGDCLAYRSGLGQSG